MDIEPDVSDVVQRSLASLIAAWDNTEGVAQIHTGNAIVAVLSEFPIDVARLVASAKQDVPVEAWQANWNLVCATLGRANGTSVDDILRGIEDLKNQACRGEVWKSRANDTMAKLNRVCEVMNFAPGSGPEMVEEILKLQDRADNAEIYALRVEKAREDWGKACEAMESDSQSLESALEKIQELKSQRHRVLCEAPCPRLADLLCGRPANHGPDFDHMAITATGHIVRWAVAE